MKLPVVVALAIYPYIWDFQVHFYMRPAGGSANPYTLPMSLMFVKSATVEEVILSQTRGVNLCCR